MAPRRAKRPKRPLQKKPPAAVESNDPLPDCEGPKLGKFQHCTAAIQFVGLLSAETPGVDGHVFEVIIESKHYALKMFTFFDHPTEADGLAGIEVTDETYIAHKDPFYAECRAYGRIETKNQNGKIAVCCHGFLAVPAEQEEELAAAPFDIDSDDWNRPEEEYEWPITARQPFRAIVKELARSKKRLTRVAQMREDLLALHDMGIYVQDIREDNYINGKLVDFSHSWTDPHMMLDPRIRSQRLIDSDIEGDLLTFDRMLEEAGIRTRLKALPGSNETGRLRSKIMKPDRFGF